MKSYFDATSLLKQLDVVQTELNREKEQLESKEHIVKCAKKYMTQAWEEIIKNNKEISILKCYMEELSNQLDEERKQRAEMEMKLAEMTKLLGSIAKKSSEEAILKAIQTFINYSKRKTSDKRTYIKNTILEFTSVNRISLPEELSTTIDCLDDEQTEPKIVTMNGGIYNDIHDNKEVNYKNNI